MDYYVRENFSYILNGMFLYRNIDDVDKTMDEINEQTENMKQIQEALATPIGAAADFDEVLPLEIVNNLFYTLLPLKS